MSELSPFQRRVADVLFDLPEADGYALAGGAALILRQVIRTEVDLAVDSPPLELPEAVDGLPVFTSLDLGGRKVLAMVDRLEARDYTDLHALASLLG